MRVLWPIFCYIFKTFKVIKNNNFLRKFFFSTRNTFTEFRVIKNKGLLNDRIKKFTPVVHFVKEEHHTVTLYAVRVKMHTEVLLVILRRTKYTSVVINTIKIKFLTND